jgi:hypothetical protein
MGSRVTRLAVLMSVAFMTITAMAAADTLAELQARFDTQAKADPKVRILQKLGDAQFAAAREAGKANDYTTVGLLLEKYRDNVRITLDALKKQQPNAERHPHGYRLLEMHVRKGIREVDETLLVAPGEYTPPLQLVRQDLIAMDDDLLRLLFPRSKDALPKTPSGTEKEP